MEDTAARAVAIVGVGAVLPEAPSAAAFWENVKGGRYCISDVTPDRWDPELYYDPDPRAPDKTYSRIGGFVRAWNWDPAAWKLPVPPLVAESMDVAQKWAVACTREVLQDYGKPIEAERTAVILGNAMAGERHYVTSMRVNFPDALRMLEQAPAFGTLPPELQEALRREYKARWNSVLPEITEDTMPGELANCMAGRVANLFNLKGPNYVCDAACASALAALSSALEGLVQGHFDLALTGGVDRNMGAHTFVKFCKIGALSATGTRPYADGADGFVMGEGAALFLLKRLADAERDGDRVYAVLRALGGSSDGRGKGITAPNPVGQKLAVRRAWTNAGLDPATASLVEGHGTSTKVGDVVEVESLAEVFGQGLPAGSVPLGSVKSNIGHLKGAAGAAGLLKLAYALHHKLLPPSLNCERKNPNIDFTRTPFYVNTSVQEWARPAAGIRRAGLSAFGFGGTNFHAVLEEHVPGALVGRRREQVAVASVPRASAPAGHSAGPAGPVLSRGALVVGAADEAGLVARLEEVAAAAAAGSAPPFALPDPQALRAAERVAIDYGSAAELAEKAGKALKALRGQTGLWRALRNQGIHRGRGPAPKVAFLYTGQGSQYVNMLRGLRDGEPVVAEVFDEADRVMTPLLGRPLSSYVFVDPKDPRAVAEAEEALKQTAITQPTVLAVDVALTRLLATRGLRPDAVMGHSLGEYGALVAAGALPFGDALEAVSARGREMTRVSVGDNGKMAAVIAPIDQIEEVLAGIPGYVVVANYNCTKQAVIGGASAAVDLAVLAFKQAGVTVMPLSVSHAFHTRIVAPASGPLREVLERLRVQTPRVPVVANVTGEFYPTGSREAVLDLLGRQVAAPVQFVKGLHTLREAGVTVFLEVGPKKALHGFVEDVFDRDPAVLALFSNHPKVPDAAAFGQAACGLFAAGLGMPPAAVREVVEMTTGSSETPAPLPRAAGPAFAATGRPERYEDLGRLFAEFLERGMELYQGGRPASAPAPRTESPVVISGAALGLPGTERLFDDRNVARILAGEQLIKLIPERFQQLMADKRVVRLVKSHKGGESHFEAIDQVKDVIKLAGRGGALDLEHEFGVPAERIAALDVVTQLAIGAGLEALRDAGLPLVLRFKTTTRGTQLPDRFLLPEALRDDTGVIFASAFPGYDAFAKDLGDYHADRSRRERLAELRAVRASLAAAGAPEAALRELDGRLRDLEAEIAERGFLFDRRFLFRILAMGHSQFAELIGARGPNTQINSACASTTQGLALAEDWIRAGRCRRVLLIAADDVTSDNLMEWIGSGFLASGAAATDAEVEKAALPFDRRRHGMLIGMGAAALVVESADAARERGLRPICELLGAVTANSAHHGTRLDVGHISSVMEQLVAGVERRSGLRREEMAGQTMFMSHETYTPARGGSASAEVFALRHVFGEQADRIVMANTKGFTGHPMGVGIEDVIAVKALETGLVPPVANFKEVDPELGQLNLSKGGSYPVQYALRLAAGFGSQISLALMRWLAPPDGRRHRPEELGFEYRIEDRVAWQAFLSRVSGHTHPELEVVQRTLRVKNQGLPAGRAGGAVVQTPSPVSGPRPVASPPTPAPAPVAPAPSAVDPVQERILAIVAQKTGYPAEMLGPDLDLEADLGIDTVKQAELFTAVREEWGIPRDDSRRLRDYPTLNHVVGFVREMRPDLAAPVAALPSPVGVTAAPATAAPAPVSDPVRERVLAIVAQKTGYPPEMLDPELDLEADLGIDTVKQAELFTAVREEWGIPRDDSRKLRDYPTLNHVVGFVREMRPDLAAPVAALPSPVGVTAAPATAAPAPVSDPVRERVLAIVAQKTGYPPEMLDPELDLEADLGIDTVKQAELFTAVREEWGIPRDDSRKLRDYPTLNHVVGFVREMRPDLAAPVAALSSPAAAVAAPVAAAPPPGSDPVRERVLAIVAQKTGYPPEMLDPELDLEADLGIDTVKQAELFTAVREEWAIPRDEDRKLRDYPTLNHVVAFVREMRPDLAAPVATAPSPVAVVAAPVPATTAAASDPVRERVLAIVAQKTGYPPEMLDPELDLEADLGIDTVKQAELFTAVREEWAIPRDDDRKLRDYPTLDHVVRFVHEMRPDLAPQAQPAAPVVRPVAAAAAPAALAPTVHVPRRVPVPVLRPALEACLETGVRLAGARVLVMCDRGGVAEALVARLQAEGAVPVGLNPVLSAEELVARLEALRAEGPLAGVYWLPALDDEGDFLALDLPAWREALRVRVKLLYTAMRALYETVAGPGTFLVSATRLGGRHGYDEPGATAALGGAVCGFTKTYKRERPEALVKVVDFGADGPDEVARLLVAETLRDPGAVEIGHVGGLRSSVALVEEERGPEGAGLALGRDTVVLVTGAAGSIVSAITTDLAAHTGGTFHLFDLVPEPQRDNPDLARLSNDREGLKRDVFERLKARGERATPALVERELAGLERAAAAVAAIEAVERAGGQVHYYSLDLRDGAAVAQACAQVRERSGRVDLLLHGAGLEISRFLPDKEPREFDLVFDVKCDGWFNVLKGLGECTPAASVAFSSIAGRFGNGGQADYASANDLLCKTSSALRRLRPGMRPLAVDWTAWGDIGMATRGSIPKMMELAGIDMLPAAIGIPICRLEAAAGTSGELLVAGRLGVMLEEWHPSGGLDLARCATEPPVLGEVRRFSPQGLVIETRLDPREQPFLYDHQIDGVPVLPGVMGVESFARAASWALPGWRVDAVESMEFLAPFKFYRQEPRTLKIELQFRLAGETIVAACKLLGERQLPGQAQPQSTVHFRGRVVLQRGEVPEVSMVPLQPARPESSVGRAEVYRVYFHGPAYQVLDGAWRQEGVVVGGFAADLPVDRVPDGETLMEPRLIELCFQTAGLLEMGRSGQLGLPEHVGRVTRLRRAAAGERLFALVAPGPGGFEASVVDAQGQVYLVLQGYRTVPLPAPLDPEGLAALKSALG